MSDEYNEIITLLKDIKEDMNKPENSYKAGAVAVLLKRIHKKIDNYERWLSKK